MTLEAVADASVSNGEPDTNYGSAELIRISSQYDPASPEIGSGIRRGMIRFDLTGLPSGADVLAVTFKAYQSNTEWVGEGLEVQEVAESWAEDSVTWNTQPAVGTALGHMPLGPDQYCPLVGDANRDGEVGVADLSALADNYGILSGATWEMGDFNGDGQVGVADLVALVDNYGRKEQNALPEPAAIALLACGAAALLRPRKSGA